MRWWWIYFVWLFLVGGAFLAAWAPRNIPRKPPVLLDFVRRKNKS